MPATRRVFPPALVRLLVALSLVTAVSGGVAAAQVVTAERAEAIVSSTVSIRAVAYVSTRQGARYQRGAQGPRAFDCSGLTRWTYLRVGKNLPRTAHSQYLATARLRAVNRRPGDLVFFLSRGRAYHVAVYAGGNRIWQASKPGTRVKRVVLWTTNVRYGRVR